MDYESEARKQEKNLLEDIQGLGKKAETQFV
jgi:hypothetical protein